MPISSAPRKIFWRALLVIVVFLAALLLGGFYYLTKKISPDNISAEATALLRRTFGFALSIGEIRLTWSGNAELRRICVRNEAMLSERCLFSADIVQLDLRLLPLLRKKLEIRGALLENCELNLFTETTETTGKKKLTRKSWELTRENAPTSGIETTSSTQMAVKLDQLSIKKGVIAHEAQVLPMPLGKSNFSLDLRDAGKRLNLTAELPDASRLKAELELKIADFLRTARLVATGPQLAESDQMSGIVECERCNISAIESRAGFLTGKLNVQAVARELKISAEGVQISTRNVYAPALVWNGNAAFALPELYPTAGEGSFAGLGLTVQYRNLNGGQKSGTSVAFDATAELARVPGISGMRGSAKAHGEIQNHAIAATFTLRDFSYSAAGIAVSAEQLTGQLLRQRVSLRKQRVLLADNAAEVTLDADFAAPASSIRGSLDFTELNLDTFITPEKKADSSQMEPQQQNFATPRSIKASLQLSARALVLGKLKTGPLRAQFASDGDTLEIPAWQVELGQGWLKGSYAMRSDRKHDLTFRARAVKVQSLRDFLQFKATLYGTADADGRLAFAGSTLDSLLKTGTGDVRFRITRGKIRDSFLQKGVFAGPLHKLEEKFSDIEFASAEGELLLNPNKIQVQRFRFDAEEWHVDYRAEADAQGLGRAALTFRFRSSFVENVANPLHLGISDRKEGDFYDLPFACRGAVLTGDCYKKNW